MENKEKEQNDVTDSEGHTVRSIRNELFYFNKDRVKRGVG